MRPQIELGIPMPTVHSNATRERSRYPFGKLQVGESFYLPCLPMQRKATCMRVTNAWWAWRSRSPERAGIKFSLRRDGNGIRVWRIA